VFTKILALSTIAVVAAFALVSGASAAPPFSLAPFVFDPGNACPGIEASWDDSVGNVVPSILLSKPCTTETVAASGVEIITSLEGQAVSNVTELNFDVKTDEDCGAGAPRFNLQLDEDGLVNAFLGCNTTLGTRTDLGNGWTHVEFSSDDIAAAVALVGAPTDTLYDLYIIFDEQGSTHIDNISVNTDVVGSSTLPTASDDCKKGGWANLTDDEGTAFKNQGDCVSFAATQGKNKAGG
jgi:hypothetical protein